MKNPFAAEVKIQNSIFTKRFRKKSLPLTLKILLKYWNITTRLDSVQNGSIGTWWWLWSWPGVGEGSNPKAYPDSQSSYPINPFSFVTKSTPSYLYTTTTLISLPNTDVIDVTARFFIKFYMCSRATLRKN